MILSSRYSYRYYCQRVFMLFGAYFIAFFAAIEYSIKKYNRGVKKWLNLKKCFLSGEKHAL